MADPAAPPAPPAPPSAVTAPAAAPSAAPSLPLADAAAPSTEVKAPEGPGNLVADAAPEPKPTEEVKPADAPKPDAPIFPDLKLPEGVAADDVMLTSFKADALEAGLTQEQAQKLVDKYGGKIMPAAAAKTAIDASNNLWKDTQKQWQDSVKADPEVGGQNLTTNLASIAKLIDSVGGEQAKEFREAMNFTGAGNNPAVVRFLFRLAGKVNTEGRTITGGKPPATSFKSAAGILYPGATES